MKMRRMEKRQMSLAEVHVPPALAETGVTHRDLLPQVGCCRHLLDAPAATEEPDLSFHRLVAERPVPHLQLVPDCAGITIKVHPAMRTKGSC